MSKSDRLDLERMAKMFAALSNPNRLKIFMSLVDCCSTGSCAAYSKCVGELGKIVSVAPSTVSHHLKELNNEAIDLILSFAEEMPTHECEVFIPHMEGAPSRVEPDATAFPHRYTPFVLNIHTRWQEKEDDERAIAWAREFHDATRPFSQGVYVNFISEEGSERVREAYTKEVWDRLVKVKQSWDPENRFRMNQNIRPVPIP